METKAMTTQTDPEKRNFIYPVRPFAHIKAHESKTI